MWKVSSLFKRFRINNDDEYNDILEDIFEDGKAEQLEYYFSITKAKAFEIADEDENLKTDYCRNNIKDNISYLYFSKKNMKVVKLDDKKYWQIQILDGEISGVNYRRNSTECWDGTFDKEDLKLLRCLVDVETGEYIYYPNDRGILNRR